jgi:hypothetical protein
MTPLVLFSALLAQTPEARELVSRAREAYRQQMNERRLYFGREEIRTWRVEKGKRKLIAWNTYEATVEDGKVMHKRIAHMGKPIQEGKRTPRDGNRRASFDSSQILSYCETRITGEEAIGGRRVWVVEAKPRADAPPPRELADLALMGPVKFWFDQETGTELQSRHLIERGLPQVPAGTIIETRMMPAGTIFVPVRAVVRRPVGKHWVETEQTYSDYKRFSADAVLTFTDEEPETP